MRMFFLHVIFSSLLLIVVSSLVHRQSDDTNYVHVQLTTDQSLRGAKVVQLDGKILNTFKGIPYAAAPIGSLRFAAPQEAHGWKGSQDALNFKPICPQNLQPDPDVPEDEDCLFLNIYTPNTTSSLPVMIWIHGGSYNRGGARFFNPSGLVQNGVVVVTINYRLGALGFMSSGDSIIPGNFGLLDQNLAMKWVQKNVHAFGGDPTSVTIFGESAGAASVSFHLVSPMSKGLFKRAIMQSGSSIGSWVMERPKSRISLANYTKDVALRIGCKATDFPNLLTCLRSVPAKLIVQGDLAVRMHTGVDIIATPTVDSANGFLPDFPGNLMKAGKINTVDTISGYTSGELASWVKDPENDGVPSTDFDSTLNNVFHIFALNTEATSVIDKYFESHYLGNETNPLAVRSRLVDSLSEGTLGLPAVLEIQRMQNASLMSPTKNYLYQYDFKISPMLSQASLAPAWMRVQHAQDNLIVFFTDNGFATEEDKAAANQVQAMWANFAISGDPTATHIVQDGTYLRWTPYTKQNNAMLKISAKSVMTTFPGADKVAAHGTLMDYLNGMADASSVI